jgi:hypothetical protein
MWDLLSLEAAVTTSFNPLLYKQMLKEAEPTVVIWGVNLLSLPLLGLFTLALTPQIPVPDCFRELECCHTSCLHTSVAVGRGFVGHTPADLQPNLHHTDFGCFSERDTLRPRFVRSRIRVGRHLLAQSQFKSGFACAFQIPGVYARSYAGLIGRTALGYHVVV